MSGEDNNNKDLEDEENEEEQKRLREERVRKRKEEMKKKAEENAARTNSPTITPDTFDQPKGKTPIREHIVASCVNFLNHPRMKSYPLSQKVEYLQKKGLTQEEIQEAINRTNAASTIAPVTPSSPQPQPPQQPPMPYYPPNMYPPGSMYPPYTPPPPSWSMGKTGVAMTVITCVGIGIGVASLAKKYIPYFSDTLTKGFAPTEEPKPGMNVLEELTGTLKSMQSQNTEVKDLLKAVVDRSMERTSSSLPLSSSASSSKDKMEIAELRAELKTLKAMLLDAQTFNSPPAKIPITSGSLGPTTSTTSTTSTASSLPSVTNSPKISPSKPTGLPSWQNDTTKANYLSYKPNPPVINNEPTNGPDYSKILREAEEVNQDRKSHMSSPPMSQGQYPKSFAAVMQMVKNGQMPGDIQDIDDKPRNLDVKIEKGVRASPAKPYERKNQANVGYVAPTEEDLGPRVEEIKEEGPMNDTSTTSTTSTSQV